MSLDLIDVVTHLESRLELQEGWLDQQVVPETAGELFDQIKACIATSSATSAAPVRTDAEIWQTLQEIAIKVYGRKAAEITRRTRFADL